MTHCVRYFSDQPVGLKAIGTALKAVDPAFKIDGGEILRGADLLGEIEISAAGSDLFAEDLAVWMNALESVGNPAAHHVLARLRGSQSIVAVRIIDGDRDPAVTWNLIGPLWSVLPTVSTGLTQSDGQGFYDGPQLVVAMG